MRIVGIDPGTNAVGVAVLENGKLIESYQINLPHGKSLEDRLSALYCQLSHITTYDADTIWVIEDGYVGPNPRTGLIVGMARGLVIALACQAGAPWKLIPPKSVKLTVCGRGDATKEQIQQMVAAICKPGHKLGPDEADAIATALAGWAMAKMEEQAHG